MSSVRPGSERARRWRGRSGVVALTAVLLLALVVPAAGARTVTQLEAEDNIGAAIEWSEFTFAAGTAPTALLSRDDVFADALASGMSQGELTAPLLLTQTNTLDPRTLTELQRLGTQEVVILGGPPAISEAVEQELGALGFETSRLAGRNRINTAVAITEAMAPEAGQVIVARAFSNGGDPTRAFADSLATAAYSAATGIPVVYTQTNSLAAATREYLEGSQVVNITVAGDEQAVGAGVFSELEQLLQDKEGDDAEVVRIGGPNRAVTAVQMNVDRGVPSEAAERVVVMEGYTEDAWAAGFPAAVQVASGGVPVLLTNGGSVPDVTLEYLQPLDGRIPLICAPFVEDSACNDAAAAAGLQ